MVSYSVRNNDAACVKPCNLGILGHGGPSRVSQKGRDVPFADYQRGIPVDRRIIEVRSNREVIPSWLPGSRLSRRKYVSGSWPAVGGSPVTDRKERARGERGFRCAPLYPSQVGGAHSQGREKEEIGWSSSPSGGRVRNEDSAS